MEHKNKGLENAIQFDNKTRTKKRKLNLQGGNANEAQLWGPEEIAQAKAILQAKDDTKEQEKQNKVARKAAATALRIQKQEEKVARAIELAANRQLAKEAKAREAQEKQLIRQATQVAKTSTQTKAHHITVGKKAKNDVPESQGDAGPIEEVIGVQKQEEVVIQSTRTRVIRRPRRLSD